MKRIYGKAQLGEVIFQLRFPTILSINSKEPVEFQDNIRETFPIYQLSNETEQTIELQQQGPTMIPSFVRKAEIKNHAFINAEGTWKVNLTSNFISISTRAYYTWEDLYEKFKPVLECFERIYRPAFYERIGLRYVNIFSRKDLSLENNKWRELIKPHLVGILSEIPDDNVKVYNMDTEYELCEEYSVRVHTGLGTIPNDSEQKFIIDADYFNLNQTKLDEKEMVANKLYSYSHEFISNAITDTLDTAMEPKTYE